MTIYFVGCEGFIKIGYTACREGRVRSRLTSMQTSNPFPIELVKCLPGDRVDEAALHDAFRDHHVRGEWYERPPIEERLAGASTVADVLGAPVSAAAAPAKAAEAPRVLSEHLTIRVGRATSRRIDEAAESVFRRTGIRVGRSELVRQLLSRGLEALKADDASRAHAHARVHGRP